MTEVPSALSTVTSITGGRARRARYNIRDSGEPPPPRPGQTMFEVVPDNATLRRWGRSHGFEVKDRGKVPRAVIEDFHKWNNFTVRVISLQAPGDTQARQYFQVRQGSYIRKETTKWWRVENELGGELFALLKKVKT